MRLNRMTVAEMISITQTWLLPGTPAMELLKRQPEIAVLLSHVQTAHEALLKRQPQPQSSAREAQLGRDLERLDALHDDLVRGLDHLCQALALLSEDDDTKLTWQRIHKVLLPMGLGLVNLSYGAEAGNAMLLQQRLAGLSAADTKLLKTQQVGGQSVLSIVQNFLNIAAQLGELDRDRESLRQSTQFATPAEILASRMAWVRAVSAVLAIADLNGLSEDAGFKQHVLSPLRAASDRANRRGKTGPSEPSPEPGPGPEPGAGGPSPAPAPGPSGS